MKKILLLLLFITLLCICGCSIEGNTAKSAVLEYFESYNNLSDEVLMDLQKVVDSETLTDNQKEVYKHILTRQYKDLKYSILSEYYDGDTAIVSCNIEVYDLYKAQKLASDYLKKNINNFYDNGSYNNNKYIDYKLDLMNTINDRIQYDLDLNLIMKNDNWVLTEITSSDLEKIHGIYNYESM